MQSDFNLWVTQQQQRIEQALEHYLPDTQHAPVPLHQAMHYAVLQGGKRIRPLLAFAAGEIFDANAQHVAIAASAVEMIHAYSLVHDDLPCMDNDVLRRGKPTCHVAFGEAIALLAGDSLQTRAFELLTHADLDIAPAARIDMLRQLAQATGSHGMAGGQAIDLDSTGINISLPELEMMHILKTGALIRASLLLGALCGTPPTPDALQSIQQYANAIGLAFQVIDDILDATTSTLDLGKTAGKDASQNKSTYVTLLGINEAREMAAELHLRALNAISDLPNHQHLTDLANLIIERKS